MRKEYAMKKILIIVAVLFSVLVPTTSVFAALGGQYYIDDLNMNIVVPYNWDVLTRDATGDDEDVALYGYGITDVLFSEFLEGNQYMEIYNDDGRIELYSYYDDFSKEVWNFADNANTYAEEYINELKDKNSIIDNMIYSSYEVYDNGKHVFIKSIAKMDGTRNVIEYDTILNGRYVYCWLITNELLTQANTHEFEKMIDSIVVCENGNFLEDDKTENNLLVIASILAAVFVVLLILVIINSSKRKKILKSMPKEYAAALQAKQLPAKKEIQQPQPSSADEVFAKEQNEGEVRFCTHCKKAIPSDSFFCPICGEKIE